jgi:hypothetical protein
MSECWLGPPAKRSIQERRDRLVHIWCRDASAKRPHIQNLNDCLASPTGFEPDLGAFGNTRQHAVLARFCV